MPHLAWILTVALFVQAPPLAPMPGGRYEGTALVHGGKIYLLGGTNARSQAEARVDVYDVATNAWSTGKPLPTPRTFLCGAVLDGKLYAIGGTGAEGRCRVVERYDPATQQWERMADLLQARTHVAAVALEGKLYVLGGFLGRDENGRTGTKSVEVYDPRTNRWTPGPPLPVGLHGHVAAVLDGRMHVLGDDDFHFVLEGGIWMEQAKHYVGLFAEGAAVGGKLIVTGGSTEAFRQTAKYDPRTDRWTACKPSPSPRYHFHLAEVGGKLYTLGGVRVSEGPGPFALSKVDAYDPATDRWRE